MPYHYLNGEHWRHIYIAGDLHGCLGLLEERLATERFDVEQDLLISIDDLIDRGPGCVALLTQPGFAACVVIKRWRLMRSVKAIITSGSATAATVL